MPERTVVRGGRVAEAAAKKAAVDAAQHQLAQEQVEQDLRHLMPNPAFRRMLTLWITQSQMFGVPLGFPHDQLREWTGRADMGAKMWNLVTAMDPTFAVEMLANRPSTPPKDD